MNENEMSNTTKRRPVVLSAEEYARQRRQRRKTQGGQSVIVAIIVLFLLLFVAGIFLAIIVGNIKNTQRGEITAGSQRFSEAGIKYLDEQLTNSPEGADWRNVPTCLPYKDTGGNVYYDVCNDVNDPNAPGKEDPDWFWIKPYDDRSTIGGAPNATYGQGGFTRVNFGSDTPGSRNTGGRALVRVTYQPHYDTPDTNGRYNDPEAALSRYIKLEVVGRSGQINPADPTTFGNTDGLGQRVELLAYKAININEYVRQITNKDNRPVTVALGAASPVRDVDYAQNPPVAATRNIENIITGPIRVNAALTFYGVNRLSFNPLLNEALEVAGPIKLNNVSDTTNTLAATDPTQVYVSTNGLPTNYTTTTPNLFPSDSTNFSTFARETETAQNAGSALVRDNPRGGETTNLPTEAGVSGNQYQNLRTVGRVDPPLIDAATGANGLTRYRALTRNSAPLSNQFTAVNPISNGLLSNNTAGFYGWGEGLYLYNASDLQQESTSILGGPSQRAEWLSPQTGQNTRSENWQGDYAYVPPAVSITLTPRYMVLETNQAAGRQYAFRDNNGAVVRPIRIVRYTDSTIATKWDDGDPAPEGRPAKGFPKGPTRTDGVPAFEGYPAVKNADGVTGNADDNYYTGDYVIYAEGNVRIRGVVGGRDPETGAYFKRHLTIVSNGTIYVDGSLLRDNLPPASAANDVTSTAVRGNSSISLLAKQYVCVNTTQFLGPDNTLEPNSEGQTNSYNAPYYRELGASNKRSQFTLATPFAPVDAANTPAAYLDGTPPNGTPGAVIFLRHASSLGSLGDTAINLFVNQSSANSPNFALFPAPLSNLLDTRTLQLRVGTTPENAGARSIPTFIDEAVRLDNNNLYPNAQYPFAANTASVGQPNLLTFNRDYALGTGEYRVSRIGVAPLDVRIEALMYAQEGSFFIIPGPWFNPNSNDTFDNFSRSGRRNEEATEDATSTPDANNPNPAGNPPRARVNHWFPFYGQPMDIRLTFFGGITENLPAEVGDESAWLEKWGWVPTAFGSTGLKAYRDQYSPTFRDPGSTPVKTVHGPQGLYKGGDTNGNGTGNGIVYEFDRRAIYPYDSTGKPLRPNPYIPTQPLPITPRLPVAPGLLYYGQNPVSR